MYGEDGERKERRRTAWGAEKKDMAEWRRGAMQARGLDGDGNARRFIVKRRVSWLRTRYGRRSTSRRRVVQVQPKDGGLGVSEGAIVGASGEVKRREDGGARVR